MHDCAHTKIFVSVQPSCDFPSRNTLDCFVCRDGIRESHVVSKAFDVDQVEPDFVNAEEDSLGFMNDIPQNFVRQP